LALAAYRENDMAEAGRWIKRAPNSPLTQWLCAKLFLRAGKLQSAAALLARISPQFPIIHEGTNAPAPVDRKDSLTIGGAEYTFYRVSVERQVQGELGVLRLARGEYVQALDSLLNAGFWMDAAYVAERVLTLEELRSYVDRFWPTATAVQVADENERFAGSEVNPAKLREQIRYLLGRRLTREFRGDQARAYYPAAWVESFDQLVAGLHKGWDETAPPRERAGALLQAAVIARTNGMELIGTEVAPDWHYHLGQFEGGVTGEDRASNVLAVVVRPTDDELRRNAGHVPDPDERFHYRYQAARLAWEAAKLLPDNDNFTAQILWQGGSFLKHRDPEYADIFYKALVRRNRKTVLGAEADRQRWFPVLDEHGNIVPQDRGTAAPEAQPEAQPMEQPNANETPEPEASNVPASLPDQPANKYVIRRGDSVASIAQALYRAGVLVTVRDIFNSNPGLDPAKLIVGQVIVIPANTH
jgi:LysM repeat protein